MNSNQDRNVAHDDLSLKSCCADVYQSDWARLLLGNSLTQEAQT